MYETYSIWQQFWMILLTTLLGSLASFGVLRALDFLSNIKFGRDVFHVLKTNPMALSIYITGRFITVLGFMAYQFGRFILP